MRSAFFKPNQNARFLFALFCAKKWQPSRNNLDAIIREDMFLVAFCR